MNWYYAENGQQTGPVSEEQIHQLFQTGKINQDTLVWREGLADWAPYRQVMTPTGNPGTPQSPAAPANPAAEGEVVCAECGRLLPASETVKFGKASVCAACKPIFLQKLSEGARTNPTELVYAGFWIRFVAKFLDGLILGIPTAIVMFAIIFPKIASSHGTQDINNTMTSMVSTIRLFQFGMMGLSLGYQIFFLGKYGATLGKMACKIRVVTSEGEKITYARATGRVFAEILSGITCYIGYIIAGFDSEKRALHDHICSTRVVYK